MFVLKNDIFSPLLSTCIFRLPNLEYPSLRRSSSSREPFGLPAGLTYSVKYFSLHKIVAEPMSRSHSFLSNIGLTSL